jgi:RNA polymerase sigma-70 factor (ECF subfamily)
LTPDARAAVEEAFHQEWGRVVATLIRITGDWDLAEECAQDAFEQALKRWSSDGVPSRPGASLSTVARNRALDRLRRKTTEAIMVQEATVLSTPTDPAETDDDRSGIPDDRLRLIFTCCHPALPFEARIALTLRTLAGLTTAEIARAFLVPALPLGWRSWRPWPTLANFTAIPCCTPPVPTCFAGWAAGPRLPRATARRWRWRAPMPNADS